VALAPEGKSLVRDHAALVDEAGVKIGHVTSGGFGPTLARPICMGYVQAAVSAVGTVLFADIRGKQARVEVVTLPFVPHTYRR
jgi:aminomethyltransferase